MSSTANRRIALGAAVVMVASTAALVSPAVATAAKKKPVFKVTIAASATTVKTSYTVKISGKVSPASRANVTLQRYYGKKWHAVAHQKLSKASRYSFTTNVGATATTLSYRVTKAKTKTVNAGVSKIVKVKVITWGTVKSWGYNSYGQLGRGAVGATPFPTPGTVGGLTEVTKVASNVAGVTAYALRRDGTVWSWGYNVGGELGRGTFGGSDRTPKKIPGLTGVKDIAAGGSTAYALKKDGTIWAWGDNFDGQLGRGDTGGNTATPAKVMSLTGVKALAAGRYSAFALRTNGSVWSWGDNALGTLGQGLVGGKTGTPGQVVTLSKITKIAADGQGGAAVGAYGTVFTWGDNDKNQLGNGVAGGSTGTPVAVVGLAGVTSIAAQYAGYYAVGPYGVVWSWGADSTGALGNGAPIAHSSVPVRAGSLAGIRAVFAFEGGGFAITPSRTVMGWGSASNLALGNHAASLVPVAIAGLANVTSMAPGSSSTYAVIG